ncbi:GDSL-type esterase/lipase family protein [Actinotalea sp. M2MS4P-6]|uniref:SGNH/GDSL hydrolase family protein n=1 Tax=Actinotalea sp. M2MS4P-6 TaxID=2983762 RepID=UPI0021E43E26|nr:SGNH/GDSL hydrolase family protein [Actinotalea sp. M2MS4P-6]MCV2394411.1 GDSL-type esterase/lipase family protein [Actinotalea sp. M2MS4P-6]
MSGAVAGPGERVPADRLEIRGSAWLERVAGGVLPHRLPARCRTRMPDGFARMVDEQGAAVRIRLRTAAGRVVVRGRPIATRLVGGPPPGDLVWDVVRDAPLGDVAPVRSTSTGTDLLDPASGDVRRTVGEVVEVVAQLPGAGRLRDVEIWLPVDAAVVLRDVEADAPIHPPSPVSAPRWVHHGSSISQGAGAASPTTTWPAVAARAAGLDLVNLGMSGNAMLDPYVAGAIRDSGADVVSLEVGINVVNRDCLRERTFGPALHGMLDTIRSGLPSVPVVVISPLLCPLVEDVPGPTYFDPDRGRFATHGRADDRADGRLDLRRIRALVHEVVAVRDDPALQHLDGRALWGEADEAAAPWSDAMHPDPAAHREIGRRFAEVLVSVSPTPAGRGSTSDAPVR